MKKILFTINIFLLSLLIMFPATAFSTTQSSFSIEKGVLDLQERDLSEQKISLDGQWEFYWQELLQPEDFNDLQNLQYIKAPSIWASASYTGDEKLSNQGFATYRLHILLDEAQTNRLFSLYLPSVASAFKIWVNGEPLAGNGVVGIDRNSVKPKSYSQIVSFQPNSNKIELVMQVSNFHQRKGGMWSPILFGYENTIKQQRELNIIRDVAIASAVLALSFYHISLYLFRVTTLLPIFLGIFCILVSLRILLVGDLLLIYLFPSFSWELSVKIEYLTFYIGFMVTFLFLSHTFPKEINKRVVQITLFICTLFSLTTLLPAIIYTQFLSLFLIWLGFMLIFLLYIVTLAAIRKREGSYIIFLTIVMFILAIINDWFLHESLVETIDLAPIAASIFLCMQTLIVAQKSSNAFKNAEYLSSELLTVNASLEQKVMERTRDLQDKNKQLRHIEESRKAFFSSVAHEIGTPMQIMQGYIQLMQSKVTSKELQSYLSVIFEKTKFFQHLSKDLLDLAKMDEGQLEFNFEHINVHFFLEYINKQLRYDIENEGLHFVQSNLPTIQGNSIYVQLDVMRMKQVFMNIVQNAIKFTQVGGTIQISVNYVPSNTQLQQGTLFIEIKDNGQGIDADLLPHIFKRFIKGKNQPKMKKGSGLGLATSMEIVKHHQGNITVQSEVGKGSTFTITIPAYLVKEDLQID